MDQVNQFNTSSALTHDGQMFGSQNKDGSKQMGFKEKKAVVEEEMRRISQLPSNSTYVVHRSRVLNKIMQLLSIEDNISGGGIGATLCRAFSLNTLKAVQVELCHPNLDNFLLDELDTYESAVSDSNTNGAPRTETFPPAFRAVPRNPIVLDLADNLIEFPPNEET